LLPSILSHNSVTVQNRVYMNFFITKTYEITSCSYALKSWNTLYMAKSTNYEAPHYTVFSNLLSLHLSSVQIFSWTPCSQTHTVYVPQCQRPRFTSIQNHRQNSSFLYHSFYVFRQKMRGQKILDWIIANCTQFSLISISSWIRFWNVIVVGYGVGRSK
jgi:hypothetical protein